MKKLIFSCIIFCSTTIFSQENVSQSDSLVKVAENQLNESKYKECIETCTDGIKVNPKEFWFYNMRAGAKEQINDAKGAISDYSKAIEVNPSKGVAYYFRGLLYKKQGNKVAAKKDIQKAADLNYFLAKNYLKSNPNAFK